MLEKGDKSEKGGGRVFNTLQFSSITFTVCLGKVRFPVLLILTMQMGVSIPIMHVVFSAMNYARNCLYCNYAGDFFIAM